jgi:hypothetical protein
MFNKQPFISLFFLLALNFNAHANWSQEVIQEANVQFLDFSSEVNADPFAVEVDTQIQSSDGEIGVVVNNSITGFDPILAWGKSYGYPVESGVFSAGYPIVIYYPIPVYYPVFYPVYAPYYFN